MTTQAQKQKLFDIASKHLIKQGKRSVAGGACLYRGPRGLKCAIGVLISDECYDPHLEGDPGEGFSIVNAVSETQGFSLDEAATDVLSYLQGIHDAENVSDWADEIKFCAKSYNLECNI